MKKLICLCMVSLTLLGCLTACGGAGQEETTAASDIKVIDFDTTRAEEETTKINKNKNYKVTLPLNFIALDFGANIEDYPDEQSYIDSYAKTYGYKITKSEDGRFTIKMDGMDYALMLSRAGMKTISEIGKIVDSGDFPYVVKTGDYTKDFGYILMLVKGKKFKKADDKDLFMALISQCGLFYQSHSNPENPKCEVVVADSESGEVLARQTYNN